jgi:hypothetical protein
MRAIVHLLIVASLFALTGSSRANEPSPFSVTRLDGRLVIRRDDSPVAEFLFDDPTVKRPCFANVHAPHGTPVTRAHPPRDGIDAVDHAAMHPGIWLAFGDISGEDFWRTKGSIEHVAFRGDPRSAADGVRFAIESRLVSAEGREMGTMASRLAIVDRDVGRMFAWEATIRAKDLPLRFGDQEEMGFGVRLATPLVERAGGQIRNSSGATTAAGTWGREAAWSDASGTPRDRGGLAGITVVPGLENFRPSWWHNRDYGLLVANPFGRAALTGGERSSVEVAPEKPIRLVFVAIAYDGEGPAGMGHDPAAAAAAAENLKRIEFADHSGE